MDKAAYARVRAVLEAVEDRPAAERDAIVAEAGLSDEERSMLFELLGHQPRVSAFDDGQLGAAGRILIGEALPATEASAGDSVARIGPYTVDRKLGEGGMGFVYACRDAAGREVAVKVIRPGLDSAQVVRRFQREGRVLAKLDHPAIAAFEAAGEAEVATGDGRSSTQRFLAMELVHGQPLDAFAATHRLDERARVDLVATVAEALHHAHERGVIHRDLKPHNILVEPGDGTGRPKIVDFGIAHGEDGGTMTASLTGTGDVIGTTRYMSPEQVVGGAKGLDARSDVYSLAVVLFELLSDELPYSVRGQTLPQVARTIVEEEPTKLGSASRRFRGSPLEFVLAKALEKSRARRYQDMAAFADDLRRFLAGAAVSARAPSVPQRALRFARRHKALVAVIAALVVGLIASTAFAIDAGRAKRRTERIAYTANLAAAAAELDSFDPEGAEFFLSQAPESLRGFEWEHLMARLDDSELTIPMDGMPIRELSFSADGTVLYALAYPEEAGTTPLLTIDWARGEVVARRELPADAAYRLEAGHLIRAGSALVVESLADGRVLAEHALGEGTWQLPVARGPGAPLVAFGSDGRVHVEGEFLDMHIPVDMQATYAVGPKAEWFVVGKQQGRLEWWRAGADEPVLLRDRAWSPTTWMDFSPDGTRLVVSAFRGDLSLWDVSEEGPPRALLALDGHRESVAAAKFTSDGRFLVSAGEDRAIRIWNAERGTLVDAFLGHRSTDLQQQGISRGVSALAVSAAQPFVASASTEEIRIWAFDGQSPRRWIHQQPINAVLGPRGERIFCGDGDGTLSIYDRESAIRFASWRPPWMSGMGPLQCFDTDGRWLVVTNKGDDSNDGDETLAGVRVYDLSTGEHAATLLEGPPGYGWRVAVMRDGAHIVGHGGERGIKVWRTSDWTEVAEQPGEGYQGFLQALPGRNEVLTSREDGTFDLRSVPDLTPVRVFAGADAMGFFPTFARDGSEIAAPSLDNVARVWEVGTSTARLELQAPGATPWAARVWPEQDRIAIGDRDGSVSLWERESGVRLFALQRQQDFVYDLVCTDDTLYSTSVDGTMQVWSTRPLRETNAARRAYRELVRTLTPAVRELLAAGDAVEAARRIDEHAAWTDREREVADQLLLRELFGLTER
ncbi:MAG: serine/threonine-protein kinase [Planctomycetota bacterium]